MKILLIDDDAASRKSLAKFLNFNLGYDVTVESSCDNAMKQLKDNQFPVIITDIKMTGMDGLSFLRQVKANKQNRLSEVILITGHGCLEDAIEALRLGALDYLLKPLNIRRLAEILKDISIKKAEEKKQEKEKESEKTSVGISKRDIRDNYFDIPGIGKAGFFADEMKAICDFALKLHQHREIPVLIEGETGTGKEIIARLIHYGSQQVDKPFISLNCAAISSSLFESELFGYVRGAFTGADPRGKAGKLEMAHGGTLLLDEISDMPLEVQPKLLRVLQEKEFYRISGSKKIKLDIRIIASTNSDLSQMVQKNLFRKDLYYRLSTAKIELKPLRERKQDILGLVHMFLKELRGSSDKFHLISEESKKALLSCEWEGNVRELRSVIERVFLRFTDSLLRGSYLEEVMDTKTGLFENILNLEFPPDGMPMQQIERLAARKVLRLKNNNISQAARYLNISRNKLKRLLASD